MRDVAIVAVAQSPHRFGLRETEVQLLMPVVNSVIEQTGLDRHAIEFTMAGSCDYLSGLPFAFVMNLEAVGAWPPIYESHVEMDGAWALHDAWLRLQCGDIDTALVSASGKSSPGNPRTFFPLSTDPFTLAPLGADPWTFAGLQARAVLDAGKATEADLAAIVARSRSAAKANPNAQLSGDHSVDELLAAPYVQNPLRAHDIAPISDGAAALVLAAGDKARELSDNPVWITGIDHRIDAHQPGVRDLTRASSAAKAAAGAAVAAGSVDVAELMVLYPHEEVLLREALGLGAGVDVNPSGGPLCANPTMATGLVRIIEVAARIMAGDAGRGVAHASSGQALQHNLVCVLEGAKR